jgi:hypothetical protein
MVKTLPLHKSHPKQSFITTIFTSKVIKLILVSCDAIFTTENLKKDSYFRTGRILSRRFMVLVQFFEKLDLKRSIKQAKEE